MPDALDSLGEILFWVAFVVLMLFFGQFAGRGVRAGRLGTAWYLTSHEGADKDTRDFEGSADDLTFIFGHLWRAARGAILAFEWTLLAVTAPLFAAIGLILRVVSWPIRATYRRWDERGFQVRRR